MLKFNEVLGVNRENQTSDQVNHKRIYGKQDLRCMKIFQV